MSGTSCSWPVGPARLSLASATSGDTDRAKARWSALVGRRRRVVDSRRQRAPLSGSLRRDARRGRAGRTIERERRVRIDVAFLVCTHAVSKRTASEVRPRNELSLPARFSTHNTKISIKRNVHAFITDCVSLEAKAIGNVHLFARLSVRLFPLHLLNRVTFELEFYVRVCVWS